MNEGKKFDSDKPMLSLIPFDVVLEIGKVFEYGRQKYGKNTWQNLDDFKDRYESALLRHFIAYKKGEKLDAESGLSHLSHMIVNGIFLLWKELKENESL